MQRRSQKQDKKNERNLIILKIFLFKQESKIKNYDSENWKNGNFIKIYNLDILVYFNHI